MVERNSKIIQWYEININPACGTLGGVFKLCLSFTLSPFECRSDDIPDFESGMLCISVISKEEKIIKVIKNKRGVELVTGHSSGYKFRKISLFVIYYLTKFDDKM